MIKSRSKVKRYKNKRIRDLSALLTSEDLVGMERVITKDSLCIEYEPCLQNCHKKRLVLFVKACGLSSYIRL